MTGGTDGAETPVLLLDRYRVDGLLGEGGLGTVVMAFDTRLKRLVAIKTLKRGSYAEEPDQFRALEERFAREAEAGSRMGSHPNLVTVHDLVMDADRTQFLILEYVSGGTLAGRIKQGPLPLTDALRIAAEAARGLQAAHDAGLVHRDIKPANIFIAADGRAQVGDFGIAQIDDLSGRTRTTIGHPGTPIYMSPEQAGTTAYVSPAADQYSLGLVLFEMLTGQAYKRIGLRRTAQLLAEQLAPLPILIGRMLAEDPDDRYPAMTDVIGAIRAVERQQASAEAATVPPVGRLEPLPDTVANQETTRRDTPRVALYAAPPIVGYVPAPTMPVTGRYSRRAILIGAGGLVVAAGTAGAAVTGLRKGGGTIATATLPATAAVAAAATALPMPTLIPTTLPTTATTAPSTAIPSPVAPIIITAPPIVITATPQPTAIPTPLTSPTAPASAVPSPRMLIVAASEVGLSASAFEQPTDSARENDGNIVARLFTFSNSYLRLYLFRGETGGDTPDGWYRVQRKVLNVPAMSKLVSVAAADGRKGYISDVAGVCDEAETKCLPCSFGPQGVVCPSNTGLIRPIHWYHVTFSAQAPGGIVVGDYFCDLANKSSRDCYNEALTILPSMRVVGPPAA